MKYYKEALKEKMKNAEITAEFLQEHKDIKKEILKQDLSDITEAGITLVSEGEKDKVMNACDFLNNYFSKEEIYNFMVSYGVLFDKADLIIKNKENKEEIYNDLLESIKEYLYNNRVPYTIIHHLPDEFKSKYPRIILDKTLPYNTKRTYYNHDLSIPIDNQEKMTDFLENILPKIKDKDLTFGLAKNSTIASIYNKLVKEDYLEINDAFEIYAKFYRHHITNEDINNFLKKDIIISDYKKNAQLFKTILKEKICKQLEDLESAKIIKEELYDLIGDLKPEFFLDFEAPETLKNSYYQKSYPFLSIYTLASHKEWKEYLIDKNFYVAMKDDESHLDALMVYRSKLTNEEFFDILYKNSRVLESCRSEMEAKRVVAWYKKYKFVPHYGVVKNFSIDEMDKFVSSSRKWSRIVKLEELSKEVINDDKMDALVKLSYTFGVFDNDDKGYNAFIKFLYDLPKELPINYNIPTTTCYDTESFDKYLKKYYKENDDGDTFKLRNDINMYSEKVQISRKTIAEFRGAFVLEHRLFHPVFGGFSMKYDPYFRDFLVENYYYFYKEQIAAWQLWRVVNR